MNPKEKDIRYISEVKHLAAQFIAEGYTERSFVTVTDAHYANAHDEVIIGISVLPEKEEATALLFLKEQKHEFQKLLAKTMRHRRVPRITFEIDAGEKHRYHVNNLLNEDEK